MTSLKTAVAGLVGSEALARKTLCFIRAVTAECLGEGAFDKVPHERLLSKLSAHEWECIIMHG